MHYELIHEEEREGFTIRFYAAPEDTDPRDCFDVDLEEAVEGIQSGRYDWFMAKVTASKAGVELGADYLGACCYPSARDFIRDAYYEDMVAEAISQARHSISDLVKEAA